MMIPDIVSIADAKTNLSRLVREAQTGKVFEVINRSQPMAILVGLEHYKALLEKVEDLEDGMAVLEGRLASQEQPNVPWEQAKAEYWASHPEEAPGVSN